MRWFAIVLSLVLAACNAPSPYFGSVPATRVAIGGAVFDVRVRGDLAEAMRINRQYAPRLHGIAPLAEQAMQQVSGCMVRELSGDAALVLGVLDCGSGTHRSVLRRVPPSYDCNAITGWGRSGSQHHTVTYECDPMGY